MEPRRTSPVGPWDPELVVEVPTGGPSHRPSVPHVGTSPGDPSPHTHREREDTTGRLRQWTCVVRTSVTASGTTPFPQVGPGSSFGPGVSPGRTSSAPGQTPVSGGEGRAGVKDSVPTRSVPTRSVPDLRC